MFRLDFQQKSELVDRLLDCPHMRSFGKREAVVRQLPKEIGNNISLGSINNARLEVLAIVDACLDIEIGLIELLIIMQWLDGNSIKFKSLRVFLENTLELGYTNKQWQQISLSDSKFEQDSAISEKTLSSMKISNSPDQPSRSTAASPSLVLTTVIELVWIIVKKLSEKIPHKVYFFIGSITLLAIMIYVSYEIPSLFKDIITVSGKTLPTPNTITPEQIHTPVVIIVTTKTASSSLTNKNTPIATPTVPPTTTKTEEISEIEYTVKLGDNFIAIAEKCGVPLYDLKKANFYYALSNFNVVHVGDKIKVPNPTKPEFCK